MLKNFLLKTYWKHNLKARRSMIFLEEIRHILNLVLHEFMLKV